MEASRFDIFDRSPSVVQLYVCLGDHHTLYFGDWQEVQAKARKRVCTKLTEGSKQIKKAVTKYLR